MIVQNGITLSFVSSSSHKSAAEAAGVSVTFEQTMAGVLEGVSAAAAPDSSAMDPEQYKAYILEKIDALPVHPSQSLASHAVSITEAGFEAMQKDPEYEQWVLKTLEQNFSFDDPWSPLCGGSYHVHMYGASREDYKGESWFPGYHGGQGEDRFDTRSAGAVWKRKIGTQTGSTAQYNANLYAKLRRERLLRRLALERRQAQSEFLEQASIRRKLAEQNDGREPLPAGTAPRIRGVSAQMLLALLGGGM